MSIAVMTKVWKNSKQKGTSLLILLALADFANDSGVCWPSVETLSKKARTSKRNAQYIIRKLVEDNEIEINENVGPGGVHFYTVIVGGEKIASPTSTDQEWVQSKGKGGEAYFTQGVKPISSKPSVNHQEPSKDSRSNDRKRSKRQLMNDNLCFYFSQLSGIPLPVPTTKAEGRDFGTKWSAPIWGFMKKFDDNEIKIRRAMEIAYKRLSNNEMTIKGPISLVGTIDSIIGEMNKGKGELRKKEIHEMTDKEFDAYLKGEP